MVVTTHVLIDTTIWVSYFNRPQSSIRRAVDVLIDKDRAALIGPVVAEILMGFRTQGQANWVASTLRGIEFFQMVWADWRAAGDLGRLLASKDRKLPLADLALGAVAMRRNLPVWSSDPHFDMVPRLLRYTPALG